MNLSTVNGRCIQHDDTRAEERAAMRAAGGTATGAARQRSKAADPSNAPKAPRTLDDAVRIASWITRAVLIGDIDVRVAEAATKAVRQFQLGEEKADLLRRIATLEAQLKTAASAAGRRV
jgi:hypothetical protein